MLVLASFGLVACSPGSEPIPSGAQTVHVTITEDAVQLDPATIRAGDAYLVLERAPDNAMVFVAALPGPDRAPHPLTEGDVAPIARGDTEGTSISGVGAGGCSPEQDAAGRGRIGPCGNVMAVTVAPGLYAILGDTPEVAPGAPPLPMGVLEVTP